MIKESLAQTGQESTTKESRVERGRKLYAEHSGDIYCVRYHEGWVWLVPSQHDLTSYYEVRLGKESSCECVDFGYHGHEQDCKHIVCATIARAKTFCCDGCHRWYPNTERYEVHEDHQCFSAYFVGERLCSGCARHAGIL